VVEVSIHAPAWGATYVTATPDRADVSIHAPAWGATGSTRKGRNCHEFQFTRPHGARLAGQRLLAAPSWVSIHAPAWGATDKPPAKLPIKRFQFTRPHGARLSTFFPNEFAQRFNSRARMGRDPGARLPCRNGKVFQFTRPHGARPYVSFLCSTI